MIVTENSIFIHLQKTGGTHVAKVLSELLGIDATVSHDQLKHPDPAREVIMGIRNPWNWYVSLWAYGCQSKGRLFSYTTSPKIAAARFPLGASLKNPSRWNDLSVHLRHLVGKDDEFWRDCYANSEDPECFRAWIKAIMTGPTSGQTGEEYSALALNENCGLMTSRFLKLSLPLSDWNKTRHNIKTTEDAAQAIEKYGLVSRYIRTEHMSADLYEWIQTVRPEISLDDVDSFSKTNTSNRRDTKFYFDDETQALVGARDNVVVKMHGYSL